MFDEGAERKLGQRLGGRRQLSSDFRFRDSDRNKEVWCESKKTA